MSIIALDRTGSLRDALRVLTDAEREIHNYYMTTWKHTSGGADAQHLHGMMAASGVSGHRAPGEEGRADVDKQRAFGKSDEELHTYAKKAYVFTQAVFRQLGLKEVTLYRGVKGQGLDKEPPAEGDAVAFKARELSSFTSDPEVADGYGRSISFKVPVDRVFASSLTRPAIGSVTAGKQAFGEAELIIMGASDLQGKIENKATTKTAADKKPLSVHLDKKNEDWLAGKKKDGASKDVSTHPSQVGRQVPRRSLLTGHGTFSRM